MGGPGSVVSMRGLRPVVVCVSLLVASCAGSGRETATTTTSVASTSVPATTAASVPASSSSEPETTASTLAPLQGLEYETVVDSLTFPIVLAARPGSNQTWIATKAGAIWTMTDGVLGSAPVVDLSARVRDQGEQGLLGMALDPSDERTVYVHYSAGNGDTVVSRLTVATDGSSDERVLLRLGQPAANHNGGMLQFGPDGALYLGLGDGGAANDRFGNGQNRDTLLGAIDRIDPQTGDTTLWSWGLRNPWRFWFDGNDLYIGDVGQDRYEEVDVVRFDPAGYNFGWPITEALHCFSPSEGCDTDGLTLPVIEVAHGDEGTRSLTGGVVYRGSEIPEIDGHYFYSDFAGGWLRSFRWNGSAAVDDTDWTPDVGVPGAVVSFGVDGAGEMYVLTTDRVLKVTARRG